MAKRKSSRQQKNGEQDSGNLDPRDILERPQCADSQATIRSSAQAGEVSQEAAQEVQQADSLGSTHAVQQTEERAPETQAAARESDSRAQATNSQQETQQQANEQAGIDQSVAGSGKPNQPAGSTAKGNDSSEDTAIQKETASKDSQHQPETEKAGQKEAGNVPDSTAVIDPATGKTLAREVSKRFMREKRWFGQLDKLRDEMMKEAKKGGMDKEAAQEWVYSELDRLYPPEEPKAQIDPNAGDRQKAQIALSASENAGKQAASSQVADSGRVQGLGELPADWPELPANASLAVEVSWVQANRLYVVEELPSGGTRVRLEKAHEPAPSRAAIGWLETSIRSYAKFVEVTAKVSGSAQDEQANVRAERMQLDEIRSLLAEMQDAAGN